MGYTALYRKFRPDTFADVKGQDAIVQTLKNQIKADRIGHAYLFCGTRGTGKTTIAKILAKAVNCENPIDGNPCNECATCRAIAAGRSMNVIEIDAASNNGVDNIREIREETSYSPTEGKYKVYIVDEVHMLSTGAFNALLKTLEEPPSYVIFILATTEAHKIPVTILSRCQRYDFKRIPITTIADRLTELVEKENVEVEEKAIRYIAKKADGAMRDALSLLDQCIAFYLGKTLTYDNVLEVLGAVDTEIFSQMLRLILARDVKSLIQSLEELILQGRELGQFVTDFTWYLRNLLLVKTSEDVEDVLDVSSENLKLLQEEAKMTDEDTLIRFIRIFSELSGQLKYETSKRVALEVALIKMCRPQMEKDRVSVLERIRVLEEEVEKQRAALESGNFAAPKQSYMAVPVQREDMQEQDMRQEALPAAPEDLQKVKANWPGIIREFGGMLGAMLVNAKPQFQPNGDDKRLYVVFDELGERCAASEENRQLIENAVASKIGKRVEVKLTAESQVKNDNIKYADITIDDKLKQSIDFPLEYDGDNYEEEF